VAKFWHSFHTFRDLALVLLGHKNTRMLKIAEQHG